MAQIRIVFDPSLKVDAQQLANLWANDPEAKELLAGQPEVHRERPGTFDWQTVVEFLVVPLAVNVASDILVGITTRLYQHYRPGGTAAVSVPEVTGDQDRTVVVESAEVEAPGDEPRT
ncbi:hypothetical protein [Actinoplanes derwentensis]|uniref:Uncharacterized protein n=1 Tax=Actinoplanes derwentensis TaxID=113562 RepID=A0A1H1VPV5_9ACTN|nr:hypothetical protein [Actinoplanes derwentensis]GID83622.1 hypothetical protein Ade03nite_25460 [Actinoplanes derwentensis]SDS86968.1 hypothetical protein SAMN04489716_1841 [Actinoplanes derwentensis]